MIQRIAVKAVIAKDNKVLVLREAATYGEGTQRGRYHMPGGRVEIGELIEDALRREVREETGLEIIIGSPIYVGEWRPTIRGEENQIVGIFFICDPVLSSVTLSDEHDDYKWVSSDYKHNYDVMDPEDKVLDLFFSKSN